MVKSLTISDNQSSLLRIYADPRSTCSRKVLMVLAEKEIPYELVPIDLVADGQKDPRYLQLNPLGKVPLLEVSSSKFVLYESIPIMLFLEELHPHPTPSLVSSEIGARAKMHQFISISSSYFKPIQRIIQKEMVLRKRYGWPGEPEVTSVAKAREELSPVLDVLAAKLQEEPYLSGESFGLADICYMPEVDMLYESQSGDLIDSRAALKDWWIRVSSRPSWQHVVQIEVKKGARPFADENVM